MSEDSIDATKAKKPKSIIEREEGAYETEINRDPEEVIYRIKANKMVALMELLLIGAVALALSLFPYFWLKDQRHFGILFSVYKYNWLLKSILIGPASAAVLWRIRALYLRFCTTYEISRRFIVMSVFKGVTTIDSCDMSQVLDGKIVSMGPVSNIRLETSDKSTPIILMEFVDSKLASEVFGFIRSHAQKGFAEMRSARRGRG